MTETHTNNDMTNIGGCQGNGNNFRSIKQCEKTCEYTNGDSTAPIIKPNKTKQAKNKEIICNLPKMNGSCKGFGRKYRYFFNKDKNKCQRFRYSGCGGNGNNFKTKKHCLSKCVNIE